MVSLPNRKSQVVTRFAPSPTGPLHLGHAYAAIIAHDLARAGGGTFLVRIENLDAGRARGKFEHAIFEDLAWLGLKPDGPPVRQSERMDAYAAALARLEGMGLLYPCFCTRAEIAAEIARAGEAPQGAEIVLYPGTCRALSAQESAARRASGAPFALRLDVARALDLASGPLHFVEAWAANIPPPLAGEVSPKATEGEAACSEPAAPPSAAEPVLRPRSARTGGWSPSLVNGGGLRMMPARPELHGDVVLARKDFGASYHLAVVVDDAASGVNLVTRGKDLLAATHIQVLLQRLLGLPTPVYAHHALVTDDAGKRLAKRDKACALSEMRAQGRTPRDVRRALPPVPDLREALDTFTRRCSR